MATFAPSEAGFSAGEIQAHVERILDSPSFRNSKRHKRFLGYIVEKTLAGEREGIKARAIGIAVFDRPPDYDLANDAIVRVAAGEIRKRLAHYYQHEGAGEDIAVDLPPGAYVPAFSRLSPGGVVPPPAPPLPAPSLPGRETAGRQDAARQRHRGRLPWLLGALLLAILAAVVPFLLRPDRPLDALWAPVLGPARPAFVCIGDLNFVMTPDASPLGSEPVNDVMLKRNHVGPNDLHALAQLTGVLGRYGRPTNVLLADNATLAALRTGPAILIGAFDNVWTKRIVNDFPGGLRLKTVAGVQSIAESTGGQEWRVDLARPLGTLDRDYALVARIESPLTGQMDLVLAGVGPYGTVAASEFLSTPEYFRQFSSRAPRGWQRRNIEILLRTDVVDGHSSPPQMVLFRVE